MTQASGTPSRPHKVVIPVAGLGTRFLPATKAVPKEMLPVVDTPALQYIVEEAVRAGLTEVVMVTGRNKSAIEDWPPSVGRPRWPMSTSSAKARPADWDTRSSALPPTSATRSSP
jgi:CTP:molybdopterin cytidylyltransferase MocA